MLPIRVWVAVPLSILLLPAAAGAQECLGVPAPASGSAAASVRVTDDHIAPEAGISGVGSSFLGAGWIGLDFLEGERVGEHAGIELGFVGDVGEAMICLTGGGEIVTGGHELFAGLSFGGTVEGGLTPWVFGRAVGFHLDDFDTTTELLLGGGFALNAGGLLLGAFAEFFPNIEDAEPTFGFKLGALLF